VSKTSTELVRVDPALIKNAATLPQLLAAIVPARREPAEAVVVAPPKQVELTVKVLDAMDKVREGTVVNVDEVRPLTPAETEALMAERVQLDELEAYIKDRKEAMKSMVYQTLDDAAVKAAAAAGAEVDAERDDKGYLILKDRLPVPKLGLAFSREPRSGSPEMTVEGLEANLDREDFLACTTQVRVVDEAKVMLHVRSKPGIVEGLARSIVPKPSTTSLFKRKA
jgi:hypothetical protein